MTTTHSTTSTSTSSTTTGGLYYQFYQNETSCDGSSASTCWQTYFPIGLCIYTADESNTMRYASMTYLDNSKARISYYDATDQYCFDDVYSTSDYYIDQCTAVTSESYPASEIVSSTSDNYCSGAEHFGASAYVALGLMALVKTLF